MSEVKIRPFELSDMEEILDIEVSNFPKDAYSKAHFIMWHAELPDGFLVAELNKKVVGYILVSKEKEGGQLISIAVLPGYQRRGIGSALLKAGIDVLKKKGVKKVIAEVRASNEIAQKFFTKHKFKVAGRISKYYPDGEDAIKFEREI